MTRPASRTSARPSPVVGAAVAATEPMFEALDTPHLLSRRSLKAALPGVPSATGVADTGESMPATKPADVPPTSAGHLTCRTCGRAVVRGRYLPWVHSERGRWAPHYARTK